MHILKGRFENNENEVVIDNLVKGESPHSVSLGARSRCVLRSSKARSSNDFVALKLSVSDFSQRKGAVLKASPESEASKQSVAVEKKADISGIHLLDEEKVSALREEKLAKLNAEMESIKKQSLEDIQNELKQIKQDAFKQGFEKGYLSALNKADEEMASKLDEFVGLVKEAASAKQNQVKAAKANLMELSLAIAEKIVQTSLAKDAKATHAIFEEALSRVTDKDYVLIRINPEEQDTFNEFKQSFERLFADIKQLEVRQDSGIKRGGCIIETKMGFIDSSVATKLSLIKEALRAAHKQS